METLESFTYACVLLMFSDVFVLVGSPEWSMRTEMHTFSQKSYTWSFSKWKPLWWRPVTRNPWESSISELQGGRPYHPSPPVFTCLESRRQLSMDCSACWVRRMKTYRGHFSSFQQILGGLRSRLAQKTSGLKHRRFLRSTFFSWERGQVTGSRNGIPYGDLRLTRKHRIWRAVRTTFLFSFLFFFLR